MCFSHPAQFTSRPATPCRGAAGFTLMELLVVIGIIAILAALLFPVISGIQASAYKTESSNNLRQLVVATRLYAAENNNFPPYAQGGTHRNQTWQMWLAGYVNYRPPGLAADQSLIDPPSNWNSAVGKRPEGVFANPVSEAVARGGNYSDYGINYRLTGFWETHGRFSFMQVVEPSRVLLFAEVQNCARGIRDGWAEIATLHDKGQTAMVAYVDGHVASLSREEVNQAEGSGTQNNYPWGWEGRNAADAQKHIP